MNRAAACLASFLLLCPPGASAQLYKWLDYNGRTRYGDVPPAGVHATRLKPPPAPANPPAAPASAADPKKGPLTPAELDLEFRKRQVEARAKQEQQEQAAAEAENKSGNCERAMEGLRILESGRRVARIGADGERYFPDESVIEQDKASARRIVEENCK